MSSRPVRFAVTDMHCANCAQTIGDRLDSLAGTEDVDVNYATDEGTLTYDPDQVDLGEIFAAIEAADVTLLRDDPLDVVKAIRVSEATLAKIKQNLGWALGYNTAMIPLASIGLLQPALAAAAMAYSSVSVLANSLLFRRYSPDRDYRLWGGFRPR